MEWIRRNWPDLLIGVALLAVIAGIIATLLSGGSFLPFARNSTPTVNQTTTTTNSTSLPPVVEDTATTVGEATTDAANQVGETVANAAETASELGSDAVTAVSAATTNVANSVAEATESVIAPVIPDLPTLDQDSAAATETSENTSTENTAVEASTATTTSTEGTSSSSIAVDASSSAAAPYRVSVGAFGNPANAENRAQTFRDAGFPVFLGSQGNLSIVLVGPYDTEFEAEQVRAQISSSGLEPSATVYRYEPETTIEPVVSANTAQAAAETPTAASVEAATPAVATTPETTTSNVAASVAPPPTASSGRYLQIGAYNSIETSMPQRGRVEGIGYTVVHIEEQGFIKLLVGPYSPENLSVAQAQLSSQGIESFVR